MALGFHYLCSAFFLRRYRKALARYQATPGDVETINLAKVLLKLKRGNEALAIINQGRRRFPHSDAIKKATAVIRKHQAKALLREAIRALKSTKNLDNYIKASDLCRSLGNLRDSFYYINQAYKEFPDHWSLHLAFAKLFYHQFHLSGHPEDSGQCIHHLRRARQLQPEHYPILLYSSLTLARLGSYADAREILGDLLARFPQNPRVLQLKAFLDKKDLDSQKAVPSKPVDAPQAATASSAKGSSKWSSQELQIKLAALNGALGLFVFDDSGALLDKAIKTNNLFDFTDCAGTLRSMTSGCRFDAERIGIGELYSCLIAGENWKIVLRTLDTMGVVGFFDGSANEDFINNTVDDLVAVAPPA